MITWRGALPTGICLTSVLRAGVENAERVVAVERHVGRGAVRRRTPSPTGAPRHQVRWSGAGPPSPATATVPSGFTAKRMRSEDCGTHSVCRPASRTVRPPPPFRRRLRVARLTDARSDLLEDRAGLCVDHGQEAGEVVPAQRRHRCPSGLSVLDTSRAFFTRVRCPSGEIH